MPVDVGPSHRSHKIVATSIVLPVLTTIFIIMRLWIRTFVIRSLGWDDFAATGTLLFCITYSVLIGLSTSYSIVPNNSPDYVKWINNADMIYLVSLFGYKLSILLLYLRLFAIDRTFRFLTYLTIFFVFGYLFANLCTQIFGCWPRVKYWDPSVTGYCIDYTKAGLAYGAMNIISDLFILVLPLPLLWRLKLAKRDKVGITFVFSSGVVTFVVAIVRYAYVVNPNAANAEYFIWSVMEINFGIICSCMPALRPLFASGFPGIHSLARKRTRSMYQQAPEPVGDSFML